MPSYVVECGIRSTQDGELVTVDRYQVEATNELEAKTKGIAQAEEHPYFDERIDPSVEVLSVVELDEPDWEKEEDDGESEA